MLILCIVVLNAVIGVVQESKAEQALAALKKLAAPNAQVLRDGHQITVAARELVPGDIVLLEAGNYVPADLRLVSSVNLKIEEAALTGESVPVEKDAALVVEADAALGDLDSAFAALERACQARSAGLIYLHLDPGYAPLRGDPRYGELVRRIGLK